MTATIWDYKRIEAQHLAEIISIAYEIAHSNDDFITDADEAIHIFGERNFVLPDWAVQQAKLAIQNEFKQL